jgi:hypothetical protein
VSCLRVKQGKTSVQRIHGLEESWVVNVVLPHIRLGRANIQVIHPTSKHGPGGFIYSV